MVAVWLTLAARRRVDPMLYCQKHGWSYQAVRDRLIRADLWNAVHSVLENRQQFMEAAYGRYPERSVNGQRMGDLFRRLCGSTRWTGYPTGFSTSEAIPKYWVWPVKVL